MDNSELTTKVFAAIADKGNQPVEAITLDSTFKDLGIDSLNGFDLLCDLEEELGIVIPDDDAREITTVGDVVDCVKPLLPTPS
jgi:acyl carrier protein